MHIQSTKITAANGTNMNTSTEAMDMWQAIRDVASEQQLFEEYIQARKHLFETLHQVSLGEINYTSAQSAKECEVAALKKYLQHRKNQISHKPA